MFMCLRHQIAFDMVGFVGVVQEACGAADVYLRAGALLSAGITRPFPLKKLMEFLH